MARLKAGASAEEEEEAEEEAREPAAARPQPPPPHWQLGEAGGALSPPMAELQERLKARIEEARAQRRADEQAKRTQSAQQWKAAVVAKGAGAGEAKRKAAPPAARPAAAGAAAAAAAAEPPRASLQFGRFEGVEAARGGRREKAAKRSREARFLLSLNHPSLTRVHRSQAALAAVEARQAAVAEAGGAATEEGAALLAQQSWGAALSRAAGDKVLDDPRLLRKSIKRANALKSSRQAAWAERTAKQGERMEERQSKRKENLATRAGEKLAKKVERREKKLLRPGFEGRRLKASAGEAAVAE